MIKTFRGKIADEGADTIVLHTNDGATGYRILKLAIIPDDPTDQTSIDSVVKVYSTPQTTVTDTIDFSDQTLLGTAFYSSSDTLTPGSNVIIFDRMIFNQDIYLTNSINGTAGREMNYYLELEQVKLDLSENTVATLKDIRNIKTQGL
jgi:hypothetical protein